MCRPLGIDGSCHNRGDWQCPIDPYAVTGGTFRSYRVGGAVAGHAGSAPSDGTVVTSTSDDMPQGKHDSFLVIAGLIFVLVIFGFVGVHLRGHSRAERSGQRREPKGSARRKATHTRLPAKEDHELATGHGDTEPEAEIADEEEEGVVAQIEGHVNHEAVRERQSQVQVHGSQLPYSKPSCTRQELGADRSPPIESEELLMRKVAELLKDAEIVAKPIESSATDDWE